MIHIAYGLLNLGSLILGLIAWVLPVVNLVKRRKIEDKRWIVFTMASIFACSISLYMQILYSRYLVGIEDLAALMDTSCAVVRAAAVLLLGTAILNIFSFINCSRGGGGGETQ